MNHLVLLVGKSFLGGSFFADTTVVPELISVSPRYTQEVTFMPTLRKRVFPIRKAPFVVISFFLVMAMAGIGLNEPGRVLEQAWQVCLSCIGIG